MIELGKKKRTYHRVGSLHRDAQGEEEEQRRGELSRALRVLAHLGRGIKRGSARVNTQTLRLSTRMS